MQNNSIAGHDVFLNTRMGLFIVSPPGKLYLINFFNYKEKQVKSQRMRADLLKNE